MNRFGLFCSFLFFSLFLNGNLTAQKNKESIILNELKEAYSTFQKEKLLNQLYVHYRSSNSVNQKKIISRLNLEKGSSGEINSLIDFILLEDLISEFRLSDFKKKFEQFNNPKFFQETYLNHRYQVLKVNYFNYFQKEDFLNLCRSLVKNAKKSHRNQLIAEANICLSNAYAFSDIEDSAKITGALATEYAKRSNSKITFALSLRNQAKLYCYFGDYNNAVLKELEFLQVANELQNNLLKSFANLDIGFILLDVDNLDGAINYFKRAQQLGENSFPDYQSIILKFGQLFYSIKKGDFKEAKKLKLLIKGKIKGINSIELDGLFLFAEGQTLAMQNNWNDAIYYYEKAVPLFERINDLQKVNQLKITIAQCYIKLKKFQNAEHVLSQTLNNSSKHASIETLKLLSEIYENTNNLAKSFQYQKLFIESTRKSTILKDAVAINELTESNLREERERFIETQKKAIEKERKEKEFLETQRTRNLLISIIIAIVLILGLIILFLRTKQIRSQQDQREAEMSQALLRTQMNPHFVFNAMSVIQSYIFTHSPEKSSKFLVNFSKLMRLILENSPKEFISLELEHEILEKYLNTQKLRFEGRFAFELNFNEDLIFQKAMVPPMITQPFVENAIEHGQLHTVEDGKINITANQRDNMLEIIVCDNGIGRKSSAKTKKIKMHKSMAINMTQERIEILNRKYRSSGNLSIEDFDTETGRGTKVTILLPLKFE
jgi:hypothetical protein